MSIAALDDEQQAETIRRYPDEAIIFTRKRKFISVFS